MYELYEAMIEVRAAT